MRGWTQTDIAEEMGVGHQTVQHDLQLVKETMLRSMRHSWGEWQAEQLMRIDAAERAAWDAWERSMGRQVEERSRHKEGGQAQAPEEMVEVRVKDTSGNVGYMNAILRCIELRSQLLGLNAPQVMAVIDWRREAASYGMSPDHIHDVLVDYFYDKLEDGAEDAEFDDGSDT